MLYTEILCCLGHAQHDILYVRLVLKHRFCFSLFFLKGTFPYICNNNNNKNDMKTRHHFNYFYYVPRIWIMHGYNNIQYIFFCCCCTNSDRKIYTYLNKYCNVIMKNILLFNLVYFHYRYKPACFCLFICVDCTCGNTAF